MCRFLAWFASEAPRGRLTEVVGTTGKLTLVREVVRAAVGTSPVFSKISNLTQLQELKNFAQTVRNEVTAIKNEGKA